MTLKSSKFTEQTSIGYAPKRCFYFSKKHELQYKCFIETLGYLTPTAARILVYNITNT